MSIKKNARGKLNVYKGRGKVDVLPCEVCGTSLNVEAHHDDYSKPLSVRWLCKEHHGAHHAAINAASRKCHCGKETMPGRGAKICLECNALRMRQWRKENSVNDVQRRKGIARTIVHVYVRRGRIVKTPCKVCGDIQVMARILDYSRPLESVEWLCKEHHKLSRR